jgi:hypothetical protein
MALNGKLVSSKEAVYRAIRDADLKAQDFNLGTMLEWAGEALDLIGCPYSLVHKLACIDIVDNRGVLPCDLHEIRQMSTLLPNGIQMQMRVANGTFHPIFIKQGGEIGYVDNQTPITTDSNGNPVFNIYNYDIALNRNTVAGSYPGFADITYTVNDNYIYTSFKDGAKVLISYWAFPVDDDGFPLIPDNEKFKSYVTWHLLMKTYYRQWIKGKVSDSVFRHSETERAFYAGAATTSGLMPTIDTMESWKGQYMHLIPRLNEHNTMFSTLGNQEFLRMGKAFFRY